MAAAQEEVATDQEANSQKVSTADADAKFQEKQEAKAEAAVKAAVDARTKAAAEEAAAEQAEKKATAEAKAAKEADGNTGAALLPAMAVLPCPASDPEGSQPALLERVLKRPAAAAPEAELDEALVARMTAANVIAEYKGSRTEYQFKSYCSKKARAMAMSEGQPRDVVDQIGRIVYRAAVEQYASL